ncbi:hypothetical protein GURASL_31260 [Geotalea uraniireducens]|uniref:ribonucleoside-diphosphate reductase n=1 Tax=Geotalea uraniireducens TaxID=351604 RepID=A0ABM8EP32_9BACT|nr:TIR domain-containing protein [Geotalea uraniireducens]BDV44203.1 hypothetical protein GURASL_31260 [Geotalea uraniireducens]
MTRDAVFISYSHADSEYLSRLKVHLRPYERKSLIDLWSDTKIRTGQQWKKEIEAALGRAAVAILLVSADFLASDFVVDNELPPLLDAAKNNGVKILPVVLKPCAFSDVENISVYQAVNDPKNPLIAVSEAEREAIWVCLAKEVQNAIQDFEARAEIEKIVSEKVGTRELIGGTSCSSEPLFRPRPKALKGWTYQMQTGCGPLSVTINDDTKGPFEMFVTMGKAGGCAASQCEALGRMVTLAWRRGIQARQVTKQLLGISCHAPSGFGENKILSCSDAVAKAIQSHMMGSGTAIDVKKTAADRDACPECGGSVEAEGGCRVCRVCGYSECA